MAVLRVPYRKMYALSVRQGIGTAGSVFGETRLAKLLIAEQLQKAAQKKRRGRDSTCPLFVRYYKTCVYRSTPVMTRIWKFLLIYYTRTVFYYLVMHFEGNLRAISQA